MIHTQSLFSVVTISDESDRDEFTDDDNKKIHTSQEKLQQRVDQIINDDDDDCE